MQHLRSFIWSMYTGTLQLVEATDRMIKTCYNSSCINTVFSSYLSCCVSPSLCTCCWPLHWGTILVFFLQIIYSMITSFFASTNMYFHYVDLFFNLAWKWWQNPSHVSWWRWRSLYSSTLVLQKAQTAICWTSISRKWPCWTCPGSSDRRGFLIWLCKDW